MKIELTPRQQRYIHDKVKSGAYGSPDEVVREGLRLLEAGDERARRVAWLQAEVERGFTGSTTPWTAKDTDRVRQLVVRRVRRSR
ncbi:MAG: type II toxin-antitoxin system ParD family antitoxin [Verrucomicrobia bacterium]|nr:type II toxin-antitoxin system ParD family antitoxin [Verrucomicrobiota bacterium]